MTTDHLPTRSRWSSTSARDYHTPPGMSPRTSTPTVGKTDGPIIVRGIHLLAALDKLHPLLKRLVLNVLDGADLQEAAAHAGIAAEVLPTVLPRLRLFLRPYVRH
jgi:hypothetical protein